jgi:hypothetical protein
MVKNIYRSYTAFCTWSNEYEKTEILPLRERVEKVDIAIDCIQKWLSEVCSFNVYFFLIEYLGRFRRPFI